MEQLIIQHLEKRFPVRFIKKIYKKIYKFHYLEGFDDSTEKMERFVLEYFNINIKIKLEFLRLATITSQPVLFSNVRTPAGRIYTYTCLKQCQSEIHKHRQIFGGLDYPEIPLKVSKITHTVSNPQIVRTRMNRYILKVDVNILNVPNGQLLLNNIENVVFRTQSYGFLVQGWVHEFGLISISGIHKDEI